MAAVNVNFKDSTTQDVLYPIVPMQNVVDGNGNSASTFFSNLLNHVTGISTQTTSGAVTINANNGVLHIITLSGDVSGITVSNAVAGQEISVILYSSSDVSVAIANNSTYICPLAEDIVLNVKAGGYCELSYIYDGSKFFVRGV